MPGGEERARPPEDHDAHLVVRLRGAEGCVELDEQATVLGIARLGATEEDAHDATLVQSLVGQKLVVGHRRPLSLAPESAHGEQTQLSTAHLSTSHHAWNKNVTCRLLAQTRT